MENNKHTKRQESFRAFQSSTAGQNALLAGKKNVSWYMSLFSRTLQRQATFGFKGLSSQANFHAWQLRSSLKQSKTMLLLRCNYMGKWGSENVALAFSLELATCEWFLCQTNQPLMWSFPVALPFLVMAMMETLKTQSPHLQNLSRTCSSWHSSNLLKPSCVLGSLFQASSRCPRLSFSSHNW